MHSSDEQLLDKGDLYVQLSSILSRMVEFLCSVLQDDDFIKRKDKAIQTVVDLSVSPCPCASAPAPHSLRMPPIEIAHPQELAGEHICQASLPALHT